MRLLDLKDKGDIQFSKRVLKRNLTLEETLEENFVDLSEVHGEF
jgi:hypothetical protein